MEFITHLLEIVLHLDKHLASLVTEYGAWTYALLFLIIFCETGLVVTPFLPGDSLLFAVGALAAAHSGLNIIGVFGLLSIAAILGDTVNYWMGYSVGPKVFHKENSRLLNKQHLERTHRFYEKYGGKTIIIARFIPIIRTFAPFVAGIGQMTYARFLAYNIIGGIVWIGLFLSFGYFFGNIPFVKQNFSLVLVAIMIISVLPAVIEYLRHWQERRKSQMA